MPILKKVLAKGVEWGLGSVARLGSQFDRENGVPASHGEEGPWTRVVEYEPDIFGFAFVIVGIADGGCDAKLSVRPVLHKRWPWVSVTW